MCVLILSDSFKTQEREEPTETLKLFFYLDEFSFKLTERKNKQTKLRLSPAPVGPVGPV